MPAPSGDEAPDDTIGGWVDAGHAVARGAGQPNRISPYGQDLRRIGQCDHGGHGVRRRIDPGDRAARALETQIEPKPAVTSWADGKGIVASRVPPAGSAGTAFEDCFAARSPRTATKGEQGDDGDPDDELS